jgi:phosphate starvation-inducible PhoH-like protein
MKEVILEFDNNKLLSELVGPHNDHLKYIETKLGLNIFISGNIMSLKGDQKNVKIGEDLIKALYHHLELGHSITPHEIDVFLKFGPLSKTSELKKIVLDTPKRKIFPKTPSQANYIQKMKKNSLVFCDGPAGTGKTFLAVAVAVNELKKGNVERIILSRPAVEAGEKIGFLPGDVREKLDPYFRPIYDSLHSMLEEEMLNRYLENSTIEIAPLAFMRGRTLSNAFIILDEAQNALSGQMKMFLTRLGQDSRMVITGDLSQNDLTGEKLSGFNEALQKLKNIQEISFATLTKTDIVRHPLVSKILQAYEKQ